jgi:hypothetical protein
LKLKSLLLVFANLLLAGNLIAHEDIIVIDGGAKPVILKQPLNEDAIGQNEINSSLILTELDFVKAMGATGQTDFVKEGPDGIPSILLKLLYRERWPRR